MASSTFQSQINLFFNLKKNKNIPQLKAMDNQWQKHRQKLAKPTPSPPQDVILPHGTSAGEDPTNSHANLGLTKMVPDIEIYSHNP
jgi:hypothetical protein